MIPTFLKHGDNGVAPPLVQNCVETRWGPERYRKKKNRRKAQISARCFDAAAQKKHKGWHTKLTFSPRVRCTATCWKIVNKIKKLLVLSIKITSPCGNDRGQLRNVRRLHSPLKLEPLEASGWGGPWWSCFVCFLVVCCVCCCCERRLVLRVCWIFQDLSGVYIRRV
jgi:hypothetical protein